MLRLVTAPSPSDLQPRLIEAITAAKLGAPFAPVTILVPSHWLVDHLRQACAQAVSTLVNVRIWTFHQFAVRFREELITTTLPRGETRVDATHDQSPSPASLTVVDQLFYEHTIGRLLGRQSEEFTPLHAIGQAPGTWAALWATIRDIREAQVDPEAARRAVIEQYFGPDDHEWLHALFTLSAAVGSVSRALDVGTADDLTASLLPDLADSRWIDTLGTVFYFGFYDLTQVQVSLLDTIAHRTATTVFFPLDRTTTRPHDAFARRFYERSLQPLMGRHAEPQGNVIVDRIDPLNRPDVSLFSAVGSDGELAEVCRRILDLVEQRGYDWERIGIVARTLDGYRSHLQPILDRYRIPFRTSATRPLLDHPLAKTILQLLTLPSKDGDADVVLDIVTSPYVTFDEMPVAPSPALCDAWRQVVADLGIRRGRADWQRLRNSASPEGTAHTSSPADPDDTEPNHNQDDTTAYPTRHTVRSRTLDLAMQEQLWRVVDRLHATCDDLLREGRIAERVTACETLLARYVRRPSNIDANTYSQNEQVTAVWDSIEQVLQSVRRLDPLFDTLRWDVFAELLGLAFERATIPIGATDEHRGVRILDGMAARGLSFDALFLIGLNEQAFPRTIREDAFLRDRHRRVLDATLGYKIDEKLAGYDEERLLFHHLCAAGRGHLVLSYQRMDDEGRARMPSPYLTTVMPFHGSDAKATQQATAAVPRGVMEPREQARFRWELYPPSDLIQRTIGQRGWRALTDNPSPETNRSIMPLLQRVGYSPRLCTSNGMALAQIEREQSGLTEYDGLVGPSPYHWTNLIQQGVSPTALETYARCPFRYFAQRRLHILRPAPPSTGEVPPPVLGKLLHHTLRHTYETLVGQGWPRQSASNLELDTIVQQAVRAAALLCESQEATGYPLLWTLAQRTIATLVLDTIAADEASAQNTPFVPIGFEVSSEGRLPPLRIGTDDAVAIPIRGTVDRLDRMTAPVDTAASGRESLRIVDYKLRLGTSPNTEDGNLARAALRATRLQPPLYGLLEWTGGSRADSVQFISMRPALEPAVAISTYSVPAMGTVLDELQAATLETLLNGIHQGTFPIVSGEDCNRCDIRSACRLTHVQSAWRSARSQWAQTLHTLRKHELPSDRRGATTETAD
ncbi:MAG: PD-(D/E)XK nuclease family protein [Nitrospiraceae bacterium]